MRFKGLGTKDAMEMARKRYALNDHFSTLNPEP
jgi:hypothetical protein